MSQNIQMQIFGKCPSLLKTAHVACMQHLVWIMIKMQWLPQILNGKSIDKALFCLYEEISSICVT